MSIPLLSGRRFARLAAVEFISETEGVVGDAGMNDGTGRIYATRDGQTYNIYTLGDEGTLVIDDDINVTS